MRIDLNSTAFDSLFISEAMAILSARVHGEYKEMPGLRLTVGQAARLFGVSMFAADVILHDLRRASILARAKDGSFALTTEPSRKRTDHSSANQKDTAAP